MRGPYAGKYKSLTNHLEMLSEGVESISFNQIEEILGFPLPRSARDHQAWWANQPRGQSLAWLRAGFRTSSVSLADERLTFLRADQPDHSAEEPPLHSDEANHLTIGEAKERLARTFGVDPSQIEITIKA